MTFLSSILIPGVNVFDIDKNIMAKMFPICFNLKKYDQQYTCCSKLNTSFCNLNIISFDRYKVYTLDRWFLEMFKMVFLKKTLEMPTPHFENQQLTNCMCILLYLIDLYLLQKEINIHYKCNFFKKYQHLFSDIQQAILYTLLSELSNKTVQESNELQLVFKQVTNNPLFSEYKAIFNSANQIEWCLKLEGLLDFKIEIDKSQVVCPFKDCIFIPIQNTSDIEDWLGARRISKYNGLFLSKNFKKCRGIDRDLALIIFGFSDKKTCKYFFCIYNQFTFFPGNDGDFSSWLHEFFENLHMKNVEHKKKGSKDKKEIIPIFEFCNIQDYLLLLEMVILSKKYKYFLKKNSKQIGNKIINLVWEPMGIQRWPFNLKIYSAYVLFYLLVYHVFVKPNRVRKSLQVFVDKNYSNRFCYSWSNSLRKMHFKHVEFTPFFVPNYLVFANKSNQTI